MESGVAVGKRFAHRCANHPMRAPFGPAARLTASPAHVHIGPVNSLETDFRMASRRAATAKADWRTVFRQSIARSLVIAAAAALGLFTLFLPLAFLTHDGHDAAIHTAEIGRAAGRGRVGSDGLIT